MYGIAKTVLRGKERESYSHHPEKGELWLCNIVFIFYLSELQKCYLSLKTQITMDFETIRHFFL